MHTQNSNMKDNLLEMKNSNKKMTSIIWKMDKTNQIIKVTQNKSQNQIQTLNLVKKANLSKNQEVVFQLSWRSLWKTKC